MTDDEPPNRHPSIVYRLAPALYASMKDQLRRLERRLTEREVSENATAIAHKIRALGVRPVGLTLQHVPFTEEQGYDYIDAQVVGRTVFVRLKLKGGKTLLRR